MRIESNIQLTTTGCRPVLLDAYFQENNTCKPIILFAHGFKGFKDWGHWHLIAKAFAEEDFVFVKFNFSHNGTTADSPSEFTDLNAFGQNNYSTELNDLDRVLDWFFSESCTIPEKEMDKNNITLIGHSRGGGTSIIKAANDSRIKQLITWAAVSRLDYAWTDKALIDKWNKDGIIYILNGRTGQQMPLFYQLYEDFAHHREKFDIEAAAKMLDIPFLIIHGTEDPAVPIKAAHDLHKWQPHSTLLEIDGGNHVFGGSHPYKVRELPEHTRILFSNCIAFLKKKCPILK